MVYAGALSFVLGLLIHWRGRGEDGGTGYYITLAGIVCAGMGGLGLLLGLLW